MRSLIGVIIHPNSCACILEQNDALLDDATCLCHLYSACKQSWHAKHSWRAVHTSAVGVSDIRRNP